MWQLLSDYRIYEICLRKNLSMLAWLRVRHTKPDHIRLTHILLPL